MRFFTAMKKYLRNQLKGGWNYFYSEYQQSQSTMTRTQWSKVAHSSKLQREKENAYTIWISPFSYFITFHPSLLWDEENHILFGNFLTDLNKVS